MKAAVLQGLGDVRLEEVSHRALEPGEVLVKMSCAAICGSDLHRIFGGYPPTMFPAWPGAPGHEGVGEVVESRSELLAPGQRVLTVPDRYCAAAFAELQALPERYALPVPDHVEPTAMVLAQQLGTVLFALGKFWPVGKPVPAPACAVVIGTGPAGLHFIRVLRDRGFETIIAVDALEHRCASALRFGADHTIVARDEDGVVEEALELTGGQGAQLVVEAAGRNAARRVALRCVAKRGVIGLFGLPEGGDPVLSVPYHELFERQPSIHVSDGAQHEPGLISFRRAIDELAAPDRAVADLVSHVFPFEEFGTALGLAHDRRDEVRKVVVSFDTR